MVNKDNATTKLWYSKGPARLTGRAKILEDGTRARYYRASFTADHSVGIPYWDEWTIFFYSRSRPKAAVKLILDAVNNDGYFNDFAGEVIN